MNQQGGKKIPRAWVSQDTSCGFTAEKSGLGRHRGPRPCELFVTRAEVQGMELCWFLHREHKAAGLVLLWWELPGSSLCQVLEHTCTELGTSWVPGNAEGACANLQRSLGMSVGR